MYKKVCCTCEVVVLLILKPIVFFDVLVAARLWILKSLLSFDLLSLQFSTLIRTDHV